MSTKLISRILFAGLMAALLFGLGSGCFLYKKEKQFFLNSLPSRPGPGLAAMSHATGPAHECVGKIEAAGCKTNPSADLVCSF